DKQTEHKLPLEHRRSSFLSSAKTTKSRAVLLHVRSRLAQTCRFAAVGAVARWVPRSELGAHSKSRPYHKIWKSHGHLDGVAPRAGAAITRARARRPVTTRRAADGRRDQSGTAAPARVASEAFSPRSERGGSARYSSVTKMQLRSLPSSALERCPLPCVSSTSRTSPAP